MKLNCRECGQALDFRPGDLFCGDGKIKRCCYRTRMHNARTNSSYRERNPGSKKRFGAAYRDLARRAGCGQTGLGQRHEPVNEIALTIAEPLQ